MQRPTAEYDEFLKQKLFELLQCTVCNTHMHNEIFECETGHAFCKDCVKKNRGEECRLCGYYVMYSRCLIVEEFRDNAGCKCEGKPEAGTSVVDYEGDTSEREKKD